MRIKDKNIARMKKILVLLLAIMTLVVCGGKKEVSATREKWYSERVGGEMVCGI